MDLYAKRVVWGLEGRELPSKKTFPLEPVAIFVGNEKMTSDTGERIRFWAHRQLARQIFHSLNILPGKVFDEVAWKQVYGVFHSVPRLFQLWAGKQVMDVAGTNVRQSYYKPGMTKCSHRVHRKRSRAAMCYTVTRSAE